MGKLRIDANLRYLYQGPKRLGSGRPKTYDGKVNWDDLIRFERIETEDNHIVLYNQVLNHVQFQCNLRVVLVVDTKHNRRALLFSTDVDLDALTLYRYYKARFQIEFLFRDAKQFTGLCDCQARSQAIEWSMMVYPSFLFGAYSDSLFGFDRSYGFAARSSRPFQTPTS